MSSEIRKCNEKECVLYDPVRGECKRIPMDNPDCKVSPNDDCIFGMRPYEK